MGKYDNIINKLNGKPSQETTSNLKVTKNKYSNVIQKLQQPQATTPKVATSKPSTVKKEVTNKTKTLKIDTSRPSMVSGGRPMINYDQKKLDKASGVASALTQSALDSATLGLSTKGLDLVTNNGASKSLDEARKDNPIASTVGNLAGYALPFAGAEKIVGAGGKALVKAGAKPITNKLLKRTVKGAVSGALVGGAEAKIKGNDVVKSAGEMAALGAGGNLLFAGAGKLINKALKPRVFEKIVPKTETPKVVEKVTPTKKVQPTLSGTKFKVNNPQYEKAVTKYNDAIETIQNRFMTNKLIPEEVAKIKTELGIDLDALTNNLAKYENKLNLKEISTKQNQKYVYGVENKLTPKLKVPSKPIEQPNILTQATTPINGKVGGMDTTEYKSTADIPTPIAEVKNQTPTNKTSLFNKFYNRIVDSKNPTKKIGEETYRLATNSTGATNIANQIIHDGLRDSKTGEVIGKSLKDISKLYPEGQEAEFEKYMRFRHNVGRTTEGKAIYSDFTPEQSTKAYKVYEKEHPEWKSKADEIINWVDSFQKEWAVKTGITSEDLYNGLRKMYPDYIPTNRVFTDLEGGVTKQGGKGFVDQTIPMSKATGSDRNLTPTMENLINIVNRTVKTAKYNEVGQSLLKSIREKPSAFAEIIPEGTKINPNVNNVVSVLEGGKPVNIQINDKSLLDALQGMTKQKGNIEEAARKVTGIYTGLITHKNPLFALKNLARDIPTAYVNGSEKNPITFLKDIGVAGKDIVGNTKINQQYKGLGGGGSNFMVGNVEKTAQKLPTIGKRDLLVNKIKPKIIKTPVSATLHPLKTIENFNSLMESAPRLAEFKRVLAKTNDVQKALYAANDVTVNFARGGDITKTINSVVPFSNASVQGLDKLARSLDPRNPAKMAGTLIKGGIMITAPTMFFDYINKDNEKYKELDNRTKDNYYLIPNGDTFIKLPKSRELGVLFGSLFERLHRQSQGDKDAFKGFANTAKTNFAPTNPLENNIFTPIVTALPSNKDFANRDIVPRWMKDQKLSPKYQYDEKTTELAKKIGETANISPKQIDYIMKSYLGVIGQVGQPLMTKGGKPLDAITSSYKADSMYSNQATTDFYDNLNKLTQNATDRNFVENIPSKRITKEERIKGKFNKAQTKITALNKKIKNTTDQTEIKSLRQAILDLEEKTNNLLK